MRFAAWMEGKESASASVWRDALARVALAWDRRGVRLLTAALCVGVVGALAISAQTGARSPTPVEASIRATGTAVSLSSVGAAASPTAGILAVDVVGKVRRPGLKRLPVGARVADAIAAAGGATVKSPGVNVARVLVDGEQIQVGTVVQGVTPSSDPLGGAPAAAGKVSLNSATAAQLEALPRIGPVTAAKIVEFRQQHGGFQSVEQLKEVAGIGDVTFAGLAPLVQL